MSYLDTGYLGGSVTDEQDRTAGLAQSASHIARYRQAINQLASLSQTQIEQVQQALLNRFSQLTPAQQQQAETLAEATKNVDPRVVTGLGDPVTGAASTMSTIAGIAALVATLGTLSLGVVQFVDQRKQAKAATAAQVNLLNAQAAALAPTPQQQTATAPQPGASPRVIGDTKPSLVPLAVGGGLALATIALLR